MVTKAGLTNLIEVITKAGLTNFVFEVVTKAGYYLIEVVTKAGYYLIEVVTKAGYYLIEVVTSNTKLSSFSHSNLLLKNCSTD